MVVDCDHQVYFLLDLVDVLDLSAIVIPPSPTFHGIRHGKQCQARLDGVSVCYGQQTPRGFHRSREQWSWAGWWGLPAGARSQVRRLAEAGAVTPGFRVRSIAEAMRKPVSSSL